jgi:hypothetical protein
MPRFFTNSLSTTFVSQWEPRLTDMQNVTWTVILAVGQNAHGTFALGREDDTCGGDVPVLRGQAVATRRACCGNVSEGF